MIDTQQNIRCDRCGTKLEHELDECGEYWFRGLLVVETPCAYVDFIGGKPRICAEEYDETRGALCEACWQEIKEAANR